MGSHIWIGFECFVKIAFQQVGTRIRVYGLIHTVWWGIWMTLDFYRSCNQICKDLAWYRVCWSSHRHNLTGGHNMPCPHTFSRRSCIWRGFKTKCDDFHVLCEEFFMLNVTHSYLDVETEFGVVSLTLVFL